VRAGRDLGCDLIKMKLHGLAVAGWQLDRFGKADKHAECLFHAC